MNIKYGTCFLFSLYTRANSHTHIHIHTYTYTHTYIVSRVYLLRGYTTTSSFGDSTYSTVQYIQYSTERARDGKRKPRLLIK